ncbi:MAG: hypothetical protein ACOCXQ_03865 [Patescibacteria group bacterium]
MSRLKTLVLNYWKTVLAFLPQKMTGKSLIYRLLDVWEDHQLQSWVSIYLMFVGLVFVGSIFINGTSMQNMLQVLLQATILSTMIVGGMGLHEIAHGLAMKYVVGFNYDIVAIFPIGAAARPKTPQDAAIGDRAPWFLMSLMLLAGPAANLALIVLGWYLSLNMNDWISELGKTINVVNTQLFILNILPFSKLDAGQLAGIIYSSMKEVHDRLLAVGVLVICFITTAVVVLFGAGELAERWQDMALSSIRHALLIIIAMSLAAGFWHKQFIDEPEHAYSHQAMNWWQTFVVLALYVGMLLLFLETARLF